MITNKTKMLKNVFVLPEHNGYQNVISRVHWALRFENEGVTSDAFIETLLDVNNTQNFIPANQVGNELALQWAYDTQGGDAFAAQLEPFHVEQINYKKACAGQVLYSDGFDLPSAQTGTSQGIPTEVL